MSANIEAKLDSANNRDRKSTRLNSSHSQISYAVLCLEKKYTTDKILLNTPVLGIVLRKIAVARFTRTLGTLITSGVPILERLAITARTSVNAVLELAL